MRLRTSDSYHELMNLGKITYNTLTDEGSWRAKAIEVKTAEKNYLALATQLMMQMNAMKKGPQSSLLLLTKSPMENVLSSYGTLKILTTNLQRKLGEPP